MFLCFYWASKTVAVSNIFHYKSFLVMALMDLWDGEHVPPDLQTKLCVRSSQRRHIMEATHLCDLICCSEGLWCCHTHPNFEISLYFLLLLFWVRYAFQVLPTVTNRASQFRRILLHRKQVHLHITTHFPIPLQSEQRYDFVDQRWAEMSLLIVEVPETSDIVMIHNIIRGSHSFWPWYYII